MNINYYAYRTDAIYVLKLNDQVTYTFPAPKSVDMSKDLTNVFVEIVYEHADFLIIKGENNEKIEKEAKKINPNINILRMENKIENIEILKNKTYVAFCGIGNPDNFFETLENHNIKIRKKIIYPDHFNFSEKNYEFLFNEAKNNNCELITTEKDYIRINPENKNKIYYTKLSNTLIGNELLTTKLYKLFK
jgi:tetraacyldisaccharide 4'-kinase